MSGLKITNSDWEILKIKLQRKYNHLSADDLSYNEGEEPQLINRLSKRLKRTQEYIIFTLSKQLADLSSNRL
ncbi:hypothetical protein [Sphingobacterium litopenaei]|uniref:General stress protein CsbD n=1 Tax=Sphingobacterium litopenaei TaxID=2763500 RepID=A0ABR7Y9M4_9SPHI|nr:hypothetical protein [Sphingobacterium litopenaei]MBD1427989.1 hypothetical protein [Sphingobacterium litopenaei]